MDTPASRPSRLTGAELFHLEGAPLPFSVQDFWRWSSSDLVGNALRGVLAEYLVATALDCADAGRVEWDAFDLCTPSGLRIEVKASGYLQSWAQRTPSKPSFDISAKRSWFAETNTYAEAAARAADVYVFALHAHQDRSTLDPLDVAQWEFYVVPTDVLDGHCRTQRRVGLARVHALSGGPVPYSALRERIAGTCPRAR